MGLGIWLRFSRFAKSRWADRVNDMPGVWGNHYEQMQWEERRVMDSFGIWTPSRFLKKWKVYQGVGSGGGERTF